MRELEASDSPAARDAIDYFVAPHPPRARRARLDARRPRRRRFYRRHRRALRAHPQARSAGSNGWASLDDEANSSDAQIISAQTSPTVVFVIPTDEERMIARHTLAITGQNAAPDRNQGNPR